MPRRSSGGRSASRPAPRAPMRNPPAPVNSAPPPAVQGGGGGSMLGGLGATIAQGLAFGTGSAVAHRAVDSVMGPRVVQHETVESSTSSSAPAVASNPGGSNACSVQSKSFEDCLNHYGSDIGKCQFYLDMLQECRKGSGHSLGA